MFDLILSGGTVVNALGSICADVAITSGRVLALMPPQTVAEARMRLDVTGKHLLPGLVDAHAHLRDPGLTHKEDFTSGTMAAALGGVTTVLDMPTDIPWTDTAARLADKMARAEGLIQVDVGFQAVLKRGLIEAEGLIALGPVSLELFTADVPPEFMFETLDSVSQALKAFSGLDVLIGVSPGDQSILVGSAGRDKTGDIAAFLASRPPLSEAGGIARALIAGADADVKLHIRQINSAAGVAVLRRLRDLCDASVETMPQNLFFTAEDYAVQGAGLKGSPPLRERRDVEALRAALSEGLIDIVATDHAPHAPSEKAIKYQAFSDIPGGMPGMQTLLATLLKLVAEGVIKLPDVARMCAFTPARRFGLGGSKGAIAPGLDADIVVIDLNRTSVLRNGDQASKAGYTPFDGWVIPACLTDVFLRGTRIVQDGRLIVADHGRVITRPS
jgi:dihydroorotase